MVSSKQASFILISRWFSRPLFSWADYTVVEVLWPQIDNFQRIMGLGPLDRYTYRWRFYEDYKTSVFWDKATRKEIKRTRLDNQHKNIKRQRIRKTFLHHNGRDEDCLSVVYGKKQAGRRQRPQDNVRHTYEPKTANQPNRESGIHPIILHRTQTNIPKDGQITREVNGKERPAFESGYSRLASWTLLDKGVPQNDTSSTDDRWEIFACVVND